LTSFVHFRRGIVSLIKVRLSCQCPWAIFLRPNEHGRASLTFVIFWYSNAFSVLTNRRSGSWGLGDRNMRSVAQRLNAETERWLPSHGLLSMSAAALPWIRMKQNLELYAARPYINVSYTGGAVLLDAARTKKT